jgi:hypothetical protein
VRRPFTTETAFKNGYTMSALKWAEQQGRIQRINRGVYVMGSLPPTPEEVAAAAVIKSGGIACGGFAGLLHGLDSVKLGPPYATRNQAIEGGIVRGYRCANGLWTMLTLSATLDDIAWEQALESALRKHLVTVEQLLAALSIQRVGNKRIRRVLALRPSNAPPTESLLETLAVQLIRTETGLPEPARQVEVRNCYDEFVARVDLAWPDHGIFLELDGEGHNGQPIYDAIRQTRVVACTGWLVGRFTWTEIKRLQKQTLRRMRELHERSTFKREAS